MQQAEQWNTNFDSFSLLEEFWAIEKKNLLAKKARGHGPRQLLVFLAVQWLYYALSILRRLCIFKEFNMIIR